MTSFPHWWMNHISRKTFWQTSEKRASSSQAPPPSSPPPRLYPTHYRLVSSPDLETAQTSVLRTSAAIRFARYVTLSEGIICPQQRLTGFTRENLDLVIWFVCVWASPGLSACAQPVRAPSPCSGAPPSAAPLPEPPKPKNKHVTSGATQRFLLAAHKTHSE